MNSLPHIAGALPAILATLDSDDDYDETVAYLAAKFIRRDANRIPVYFESVVQTYRDEEFKRTYRLSRRTFAEVAARYETSPFFPKAVQGRRQIPADKTVAIALTYLGSQSSMYAIAEKFDVAESTVHNCITRVIEFLHYISEDVISWPTDTAELERSKAAFRAKSGGKGPCDTIGCVDGSHIQILKPSESPESYFNRKKFPSIILQGICNDQNKFLDVFIGYPGSVHDARVLKESPFYQGAEGKCSSGYILGDSAYPLSPWLLTPYRDTERTFPAWKRAFNKRLNQQRVAIENTFGLLKQRFRRLYLVDAKTIGRCCYVVMAACVLHNLCNAERDFMDEPATEPRPVEVGNDEDVSVLSSAVAEDMRRRIAMQQC